MPRYGSAAALIALTLASCAQRTNNSPRISLTGAWSRATVTGQSSAAVYLTLTNDGDRDERLLAISTPVGKATLHSTSIQNGVMRMRPIDVLVIPSRSQIQLKPGGMHIMITGVKQPLQAGTGFPLTFAFQQAGRRTTTVNVQPSTTDGAAM